MADVVNVMSSGDIQSGLMVVVIDHSTVTCSHHTVLHSTISL